jgi:hypothetical protein
MADDKIDPRLRPDAEKEAKARIHGSYSIHPVIDRITKKFGAFNLIRNAKNDREARIEEIDNLQP